MLRSQQQQNQNQNQTTSLNQSQQNTTTQQEQIDPTRQATEAGNGQHSFSDVICEPCSRNFIVASVGSGKSTLGSLIVSGYHDGYPDHRIYVLDYKRRFFPEPDRSDGRAFPLGVMAYNHGRRQGVSINGVLANTPARWYMPRGGIAVIQDAEAAEKLFQWLYKHQDIRRPVFVYADETFDLMSTHRANPDFRKLIQMGRELGIGTLVINQRPSYIDRTFITESDRIYYGQLHSRMDREYVLEETALKDVKGVKGEQVISPFTWWLINQKRPHDSFYFELTEYGTGNGIVSGGRK